MALSRREWILMPGRYAAGAPGVFRQCSNCAALTGVAGSKRMEEHRGSAWAQRTGWPPRGTAAKNSGHRGYGVPHVRNARERGKAHEGEKEDGKRLYVEAITSRHLNEVTCL